MTIFSGLERHGERNWVHPSCCLGRGEFYQLRRLFYGALELAAGGVDVAAAGAADVGGDAGGHDAFLEGGDGGLRRLGYSGDEMTAHGFRSMASTLLNEQGAHPDLIELQLAHAERNTVRAAYNRAQRLAERREMMQDWRTISMG